MMAVALLRVAGPLLTNFKFGSRSEDFPLLRSGRAEFNNVLLLLPSFR